MTNRLLALLSLAVCLTVPFLFFWGRISDGAYRSTLVAASLGWFVFATIAMQRRR